MVNKTGFSQHHNFVMQLVHALFSFFFRIKAYIGNGWSNKVYNPDVSLGYCSNKELVKYDSTVSPPTEGWKTIQSVFQS